MTRTNLTIHVHRDPPPIPVPDCVFQGYVDGEEERYSTYGPDPYSVLREIADMLENEDA